MKQLYDKQEQAQQGHPIQRFLLLFYFLYVAAATLLYGIALASHFQLAHDWAMEDWLMNYSGGFVRRGLIGTAALSAGRILHIQPVWLAAIAQYTCYIVTLTSAYLLLRRKPEHSPWTWALVLSPATFAFQLLDHVGGFRKELLLFAGLGALLVWLRRSTNETAISVFLCLWLPFLILSHESTFFYIGYYFAAVLLYQSHTHAGLSMRRAARVLVLPLLLAVASMTLVCLHTGNRAIASVVCRSIEHTNLSSCGEGIRYLGFTPAEARADADTQFSKHNYPLIYILLGGLSIAPVVTLLRAGLRQTGTRRDAILLSTIAGTTFVCSLPLYLFAVDWGRWIYINVLSLALLLFYLDWDHRDTPLPGRNALRYGGRPTMAAVCALILYATLWSLPHLPIFGQFYGYAQRVDHSKAFRKYVLHRDPVVARSSCRVLNRG